MIGKCSFGRGQATYSPLFIDKELIPKHDIRTIQMRRDSFKNIVIDKQIASIHKNTEIPLCHPHPFVHRLVNTAIRLGNPSCNFLGISFKESRSTVTASSVNNNAFEIGIILSENGIYSPAQRRKRIICDGDNGDFHTWILFRP